MSKFELKGKNGLAYVFTNECDEATISQIIELLNSPVSIDSQVRIMPDCHAGAGCVIGTTMTIQNKVCPNLVGVDIGCGMLTINLGKQNINQEFLNKIDKICHIIPSGMDVYESNTKGFYSDGKEMWQFSKLKFEGNYPDTWFKQLKCYKSLRSIDRLIGSLGTLGGGNHFIELDKDDKENVYLVIHSGSRNLGLQVAKYYQDIAINKLNDNRQEKEKLINQLRKQGREKEIAYELERFDSINFASKIPKDLAFLENEDMLNYLHDMNLCQDFASENRKAIAKIILSNLFECYYFKTDKKYIVFNNISFEYFETIHNYIDIENKILRKGAISAQKGEMVLIPLNMRDGSLICEGLGNPDWNFSAPHGAGRIMSRAEAKQVISLNEFEDSMKGIYSSTINKSTIDESPMAYKPMQSIIDNVGDTVKIIERIVPIYNFKASEEEPSWKKKKEIKKNDL